MVTSDTDKASILNQYFISQSKLPPIPPGFRLPPLHFVTDSRISSIQTTEADVLKILKSLKIDKANGPDGISNRLLKSTAESLAMPLSKLFNLSLSQGKFPSQWKQANVSPIHKKDNRQHVSNYRPISLLSCISKVLEKVVFLKLYKYSSENSLLTEKNSGFKPLDSTINQLIHITNTIYEALNRKEDVCAVYLDVSRAFDKVYHPGLIHKFRQMGIEGPLLDWLQSYLSNRKQRVVINGSESDSGSPEAGVPQGSILGPLFFLFFINDIVNDIESLIYLFADDTSLMEAIKNITESFNKINRDLQRIQSWANQWLVTFNAVKTVFMYITLKQTRPLLPNLYFNNSQITEVTSHTHLGLTLSNNMSWCNHISRITNKASKCLTLLKRIRRIVPRSCLETLFTTMIRPILEYGCPIFDNCTTQQSLLLEKVQREGGLLCTGAYRRTNHVTLLSELGWSPLATRRKCQKLTIFYKMVNQLVPAYLSELCPMTVGQITSRNLRNSMNIQLTKSRITCFKRSFLPSSIKEWNQIPIEIRNSPTLQNFKTKITKVFYSEKNKLFSSCTGPNGINHSRLRMGLSALNSHRHNYSLINYKNCVYCNAPKEDALHYFLQCSYWHSQRVDLLTGLCSLIAPGIHYTLLPQLDAAYTLNLFLCGCNDYSSEVNQAIFTHVQKFIENTDRFL